MPNCSASAWASCSSLTRPMSFGDLAEQLPRVLLLLFEQHLELLVGDETQVDQNLSDATNVP